MLGNSLQLNQKLSLGQTITPQMIQTLKLVQYSAPELLEFIQHELSDNPFLESEESSLSIDTDKKEFQDQKDYVFEYGSDSSQEYLPSSGMNSDKKDATSVIEQTLSEESDLGEVLEKQLHFVFNQNSTEYKVGLHIISLLSEDGYLDKAYIKDIAEYNQVNEDQVLDVLSCIQDFEPDGIASLNLKDCLLKQLESYPDYDTRIERQLIESHLDQLKPRFFNDLCKQYNIDQGRLQTAVQFISHLEPKPARKYSRQQNTYILPDIAVHRIENQLQIQMNNRIFPRIRVNQEYRKLLKQNSRGNKELTDFLKDKEEKAGILLNSLRYRKSNLEKVVTKLLEVQNDFFYQGPSALKPYTLVKLAEELEINQGTISRIVNSKFIETEWGVFSLRIFFSSSLPGKDGEVSSNQIKQEIQKIIQEYDESKKLSDSRIVEILKKKGFQVARRTVAKYRKQLQILSSFHR